MSDQTLDPRLDSLLRDALKAEAARLPMRVTANQVMERAAVLRRASLGSRFGLPRSWMAVAGLGAAVLVVAVVGYSLLPGLAIVGPGATPSPSPTVAPPSTDPSGSGSTWWPQTTLQEVREAQERADAGDPAYTWQVEPTLVGDAAPWDAEILDRFAREALGWEGFQTNDMYAYGDQGSFYTELVLFRCAPGLTNPLYPDDPRVGDCAPTIDDFRYETVMLTIEQPVRRSPTGIWVVTEWKELQPRDATTDHFQHFYYDLTFGQVAQVAPPSDTEAIQLLEAFLAARIGGSGAEQLVHEHAADPEEAEARFVGPSDYEVPVLYATSRGAAYERSEIERLEGPVWPTGHIVYRVRLFAEDGVVVEQSIAVVRLEDGGVGLMYHPHAVDFPTTEDGQPVPIPYTFLDGEVSFSAALPWDHSPEALYLGNPGRGERLDILADPLTAVGCEPGPAPADAAALAESIRANPDLEATDPVSVSIGGIAALQMDVTAANGASLCPQPYQEPLVLFKDAERPWAAGGEDRLRLYLLDMPAGSAQVLAIVVAAPQSEFDRVLDAATPVIESIRFDLP